MNLFIIFRQNINTVQQKRPNQEPPIDLVEQFYKENVDLKAILNARKAKKEVTSGLEPYTGEFGPAQKKHLLNRTMVGMAKRHMDDLEGLSIDEAIDLIFTPEELGEPVNNYFYEKTNEDWIETYGRNDVAPGQPFVNNASTRRTENSQEEENGDWARRQSIKSWIFKNIYSQNTSIHWRIFIFLHNLIPTDGGQGSGNKGLYGYLKLLFDSCYDDYRNTIFNVTTNPAMLIYLNLAQSRKENPDENFAREVQELFTVGKTPFSKYTERDVREIARALVGWGIDYESIFEEGPIKSKFNPWNHDIGDKYFSEFYKNTIIKGKDGVGGANELKEVINMIFNTEESAIYISRRLYQFFVYHDITLVIEENVIKPMAKVMRENDFSLIEPLKLLLKSEHFFDVSFYNSMIKSPLDFIYGITKEFDLFNGDLRNYDEERNENNNYMPPERLTNSLSRSYYFFRQFEWVGGQIGMELANPPSVSGWPAYYQSPVYDLFWINSKTIKDRVQYSNSATQWGIWMENGYNIVLNKISYILTYSKPDDLDALISELSDRLLGGDIPLNAKNRIKKSILQDKNEAYWKEAIDEYKNNPNEQNKNNLDWRIQNLLSQFFQLGEITLF